MAKAHLIPALIGLAAATTSAAEAVPADRRAVEMEAELSQQVIAAGADGHIYLRLSLKAINAGTAKNRPEVNVALVIDRSGSMQGDRIDAAKEAATVALDRLGANDIVSLVSYNHKVDVPFPATRLEGRRPDIDRAVARLLADGTTALYAGAEEGGEQVLKHLSDTRVNRVVLLSDGLANVGPSTPGEVAELGRKLASKGISVTTIGLGLDYNEDLMQRLAAASDGNHAFVEHPRQLAAIFDKEFGDAFSVTARDIEIIIECQNGFVPLRALGREADISGNRIKLRMGQLQADNERYVVLELKAPTSAGAGTLKVADAKIAYLDLARSSREESATSVEVGVSQDAAEAARSVNNRVMSNVTEQIATEATEKAVELRDNGDVAGARKLLEENAAYINRQKSTLSTGAAAAPAASIDALDQLERKSREAASNLDGEEWGKTRKSMRYDQHKSKAQQSY